jgi:hypothetical protein
MNEIKPTNAELDSHCEKKHWSAPQLTIVSIADVTNNIGGSHFESTSSSAHNS